MDIRADLRQHSDLQREEPIGFGVISTMGAAEGDPTEIISALKTRIGGQPV